MTAGSGSSGSAVGRTYPDRLAVLSKRPIYNGGVGGETSTQIKTRLLAASPAARLTWPTIIWAGRNNYFDSPTVQSDVAAMVAALGHSRYLVLSVINKADATEYSGTTPYNQITALNAALAATYATHFVDVRSYLVSQYDPAQPQDVLDHAGDAPPTSLHAAADPLHLNDAGYQAVANKVYESIALLGVS